MLNHTAIFYDTERILKEINMTEDVFRDIMVLSGTDYNMNNETNLVETLKWFNEYNRSGNTDTSKFYEWLLKNTRYIKDINGLLNIKKMFEIETHDDLLRTIDIDSERNTRPDNITLKGILSDDGFIFA
jgi:hypothetical protein